MLQNYVTIYSQNAKLWNVTDYEVITLLELERNLTMVDILLQPILEKYNTSFGESYINVLVNRIFVYTVDPTKIDTYEQSQRLKPILVFYFIDIEFNNAEEKRKQKKGEKKNNTHDNRLKNGNMVNESQVHIMELKNAELKENRVQEALTDSSSLNTSWADDTEATYGKGGSLGQSKLTENSFLSSSGRSEDLMVDRIEEIDLETLRIEEEKNNKLTEEKEKRESP
ncbi:3704_t:CDS:2, partial [Gigaspora margarita]